MSITCPVGNPNGALAWNSEYILRTSDCGDTWIDVTSKRSRVDLDKWCGRGWNGWCSKAITFNPYRKGQSVLQAMDAGHGWLSNDALKSWRYVESSSGSWSGGVSASFTKDGWIYLSTGQRNSNVGILISSDGGKTWRTASGENSPLAHFGKNMI